MSYSQKTFKYQNKTNTTYHPMKGLYFVVDLNGDQFFQHGLPSNTGPGRNLNDHGPNSCPCKSTSTLGETLKAYLRLCKGMVATIMESTANVSLYPSSSNSHTNYPFLL